MTQKLVKKIYTWTILTQKNICPPRAIEKITAAQFKKRKLISKFRRNNKRPLHWIVVFKSLRIFFVDMFVKEANWKIKPNKKESVIRYSLYYMWKKTFLRFEYPLQQQCSQACNILNCHYLKWLIPKNILKIPHLYHNSDKNAIYYPIWLFNWKIPH